MFELFVEVQAPAAAAAGAVPSTAPVPAHDPRAAAEFAECSGAILAKLVADAMASVPDIPDTVAGDGRLLDLITATSRLDAWSESIRARLIAMLYQRTLAEHRRFGLVAHADGWGTAAGASHGFDDVALTRAEIAANLSLELGQSLPVADRAVTTAELDHVPDPELRQDVAAALTTDPQQPGTDDVLVRELRGSRKRLWDLPPAEIRAIVRREVAEREPALPAERCRRVRADRRLRYHPLRDGMAELVLHGPAEMLTAAHHRVDDEARAARRAGAPETLDQFRHDLAVDWLTKGGSAGAAGPRFLIDVAVADTTFLGLDDLPATLHGPAGPEPLPAELARRLAYDPEQATWRRILLDPSTGVATDVSRCYPPPPQMAEFVRVRDGHRSRFPTSGAARTELDHVAAFDRRDPAGGGPTSAPNLASAGRLDHHLKTDGALSVSGDANGSLTFETSAGRRFTSFPHQYLDPHRAAARIAPIDPAREADAADAADGPAAHEAGPDPPF